MARERSCEKPVTDPRQLDSRASLRPKLRAPGDFRFPPIAATERISLDVSNGLQAELPGPGWYLPWNRARPCPSNSAMTLLLTGKRILVDDSIFHDDLEILGGVGKKADIVQGISVDEQQIRECALFHDAELAGIRIPFAR